MPEILSPIQVQDAYTRGVQIGPSENVAELRFSVSTYPIYARCWRYVAQQPGKYVLETYERLVPSNTIDAKIANCAGVQFRNASTGNKATVWGELDYVSDANFDPGAQAGGLLLPSGLVLPGVSQVNPVYVTGSGTGLSGSGTFSRTLQTLATSTLTDYELGTLVVQGYLENTDPTNDGGYTLSLSVGGVVLAQKVVAIPAGTVTGVVGFELDISAVAPFQTNGGAVVFAGAPYGSVGFVHLEYDTTAWQLIATTIPTA